MLAREGGGLSLRLALAQAGDKVLSIENRTGGDSTIHAFMHELEQRCWLLAATGGVAAFLGLHHGASAGKGIEPDGQIPDRASKRDRILQPNTTSRETGVEKY
jgi:hypothetical protein